LTIGAAAGAQSEQRADEAAAAAMKCRHPRMGELDEGRWFP
jgi:hypothetical protein